MKMLHSLKKVTIMIFSKKNNMKIQYLKPYSMLCFYFTSEKRVLNSSAFNIHIFQNTLNWSKILANKTYIVSCCNFRKIKIYILFINTHSRKCCRVKIIQWKLHYVHIADTMKILYYLFFVIAFFSDLIYIIFSIFEKYGIFNIRLH
jgi:hypothetical protein